MISPSPFPMDPSYDSIGTSTSTVTDNAPHSPAPNKVGVTPNDSDLVNLNQVTMASLTRLVPLAPIGNWLATTTSGGQATLTPGYDYVGTSTSTGSSGIVASLFNYGLGSPSAAQPYSGTIDFSKTIWVKYLYAMGSGEGALPNTILRGNIAITSTTAGTTLPSAAAAGFKIVFDTSGVGHFYGEAYNSSLIASGSSLATLSSGYSHTIVVESAAGTLTFFVDGTNVGTLTGGPSTAQTGTANVIEYSMINNGDSTALQYIRCFQPSVFVEN